MLELPGEQAMNQELAFTKSKGCQRALCGQRFDMGRLEPRLHSAVRGFFTAVVVAAFTLCATSLYAVVVTDDFSDFNDTANPAWTHLDGAVGSTGQTWDASTGEYHLIAPSNGAVPGLEGYGFVGSHVGPSFTDVRVSVDIKEFPNVGPLGSFFGVIARSNGDNRPPTAGVGIPIHAYNYQYEASANSGLGEMTLNILYGDGLRDIRSQKGPAGTPLLDNTKDYRIVLEVIGDALHGQVFELDASGNIVRTVAEQWRDVVVESLGNIDHDGDNSTPQVPFEPYTSGFSGVAGVGYILASDADFTIDNFRTETAAAGDYNRNGVTDGADYVLWRKTMGNTGPTTNPPLAFNDMRANGAVSAGEFSQVIDQADYDTWRTNFGTSVSGSGLGGGGAVPEPTSAAMALLGLAASCFAFRRRHRLNPK
jgi:PEP-CTERM motif